MGRNSRERVTADVCGLSFSKAVLTYTKINKKHTAQNAPCMVCIVSV